jgi:hypothetical protein
MKRRAILAMALAGLAAAAVRLRGGKSASPQRGGWRELSDADLH